MKYEFGIIFDFYPLLKRNDPTSIFADEGHERLLYELLRFIVDDPAGYAGGLEELLSALIEQDILHYHVVLRHKRPYVDIPELLLNLCTDLVDMLKDTGFFEKCQSFTKNNPQVLRLSRDSYVIMAGPKRGKNEETAFHHKSSKFLRTNEKRNSRR